MRIIADLHIHSKYSRACSPELNLPNIDQWCQYKGIDLIATSDFTHPQWFKDIKEQLEPLGNGLFQLRESQRFHRNGNWPIAISVKAEPTRFILGTEIALRYKQDDKSRWIHVCVFFPEIKDVEALINLLDKTGYKYYSDGRPMIGWTAQELAQYCLDINEKCILIPAHAWTPWCSIFGSKSGFDSIEECFGKYTKYIYAIETGLSSDPPMNWRLSALDNIFLVSNSDCHSLANLGREANVFELDEVSYDSIYNLFKNHEKEKFKYTIEFFPEEGKYHLDGHAKCGVSMMPEQTEKNKGICPVCKKPLIVGVYNRVAQLADRQKGKLNDQVPFKSIVPLQEIIAESFNVGKGSKKVQNEYFEMLKKGGSEFEILLDKSLDELKQISQPEVVEAIKRVREGKLFIQPGYDGVYGIVKIFTPKERKSFEQGNLI